NEMKNNFIRIFMLLASPFCTIIEVFIRKNMGRRYFKLSTSVILTIFLLFYLLMNFTMQKFFNDAMAYSYREQYIDIPLTTVSFIVFLIFFAFFSYKRSKETKLLQSEFDMNHFSLSNGEPLPFFTNFKI